MFYNVRIKHIECLELKIITASNFLYFTLKWCLCDSA